MGSTILFLFNQELPPAGQFFYAGAGTVTMSGAADTSHQDNPGPPEPPVPPIPPDGLPCVQNGERVYVKWKIIKNNYVAAITVCIYDL